MPSAPVVAQKRGEWRRSAHSRQLEASPAEFAISSVAAFACSYSCSLPVPREKESGGALDIPGGGKLIELEYAQVEDRKLRGQLRNVSKLELLVKIPPTFVAKSVCGPSTGFLLLGRTRIAFRCATEAVVK